MVARSLTLPALTAEFGYRSGEVRLGIALSFIMDSIRLGEVVLPEPKSTLPSTGLTRDEVMNLIAESITSTSPNPDDVLKIVNERISMIISTLSLPTADLIDERLVVALALGITSALTPLEDEISEVAEFSRNLQGEIVKVKKPLANDSSSRKLRVEVQHAIATSPPTARDGTKTTKDEKIDRGRV